MGFLSAYTGNTRVKVGPADSDYWVDVKKFVTQGGQEQAEKALLKMVAVDGSPEPRPDVASYRKHMVLASIDDWNLDGDDGKVMPVNLQSVQRLPISVFNQLWLQVQENNSEAQRSPEDQLDFRE